MKLRKGMAAALAVCVLGSTAGCNREEPIDTSAIETIPARFIDALATDNASAMISITRDYDYAEDTEDIRLGMGDYYDLFEHFVSLTEITEFGEIVLDEVEDGEEQTAEVDVTFSYVDTARLVSSLILARIVKRRHSLSNSCVIRSPATGSCISSLRRRSRIFCGAGCVSCRTRSRFLPRRRVLTSSSL